MENKTISKTEATTSNATITLRLIGSPIRRDGRQREYIKALGLRKLGSERTLQDSPAVRGLIRKAGHMLQIID